MGTIVSPSDLPDYELVALALSNSTLAFEEVKHRFSPYITQAVRRRAPDLIPYLDEIEAEVWAGLTGFVPGRGSVRSFLVGMVMTAIQRTWANYCPPGQPHRLPPYAVRREVTEVALEAVHRGKEAATAAVQAPGVRPWRVEQQDARIDLENLITSAPDTVRRGLSLMYDQQLTVTEAAAEIGITRFKLRRHISRYADSVAAAYADYLQVA